ncbi:MAG: SIR2 family protein [Hyphomicrobiaceae bacterium]
MWFLGGGASRAAGIKTAGDMIWDFKQRLYRSQKKLPPSAITDIGEIAVQQKLQDYFDALGGFPSIGALEEYSAYFEATYLSASNRRIYLEELTARGKPSFGRHALAPLMRENLCRIVWSTNFDRTLEDAAVKVLGGTGNLVVADLAEPEKIRRALVSGKWPVYGKLHGDYHSEKLKNTDEELQKQDAEMRGALIDACRQQGLAVIGYSGRDASVIEALTVAFDNGKGFPAGLFWFKRSQDTVYPAVSDLIRSAREHKIEAYLIEAESFDELFSDLLRFLPKTYEKVQSLADTARPRLAATAILAAKADVPAIRTNALPVTSYPAICRLVECGIGGFADIEAAIQEAEVDIDARRCREGVVAFGRDVDIRKAFEPYTIRAFEPYPIASSRLTHETGERGVVRDALFRALGNLTAS